MKFPRIKSRNVLANILLSCACSVFLFAAPAFAQIDTGGVTGTVTDSTGAIVAGATVKLVNEATGVSSAGVSTFDRRLLVQRGTARKLNAASRSARVSDHC